MIIAHTADIHAQKSRMDEVLASLLTLEGECVDREVDLIAIAGDLYQAAIHNTENTRFPEFVAAIQRLANVAPVVLIYGTPSHDIKGSLEVLEQLDTTYGVTILRPGVEYFLTRETTKPCVFDDDICVEYGLEDARVDLLIFGIPEPSKDWLLAGQPAMGKDESDAAMREGMQKLLLGLAAQRKQHSDIPCLVLYHGQIRGATMDNGEVIENALGRDDLAMIDADYYALGDIHKPQQIGDLPMYYPGSIYPNNWGETHQCGFNVVEIRDAIEPMEGEYCGFFAEVTRVPYPHPQQRKIETNALDSPPQPEELDGYRVWWEITVAREEAGEINTDNMLAAMKGYGAVEGSKVTIKVKPTETVRAGQIAKATTLPEKVALYAENSGEEVAETVLLKANLLEAERDHEGSLASHHWRIKRLSLRGAIGIWKGIGTDQVDIDLDDYDRGILALAEPNGKGKSTLIENMQPWPTLITRDGALSAHFRLKDSHRDLYVVDELTGDEWRFLIQINGTSKAGSCEYHVYRNDEPYGDSNGRKEPYIRAIAELFGSFEMFLRSAFVSQRPTKGNPDLADATKGERKQLFRELAGLDYLQVFADAAKERAKALSDELATDAGWIEATKAQVAGLPAMRSQLEEKRAEADEAQKRCDSTEQSSREVRTEYDLLTEKVQHNKTIRRQKEEAEERSVALDRERQTLLSGREALEAATNGREDAEENIRFWQELDDERKALEKTKQEKLDARIAKGEEYNAQRETYDSQRAELEEAKRVAESHVADLAVRRQQAINAIELLGQNLDRERHDTCPECKARLPWADGEDEQREKWKEQLDENQKAVWEIDKDIPEGQDAVESAAKALSALVPPEQPKFDRITEDERLQRIAKDQAYYKVDEAREIVEKAKEAAVRIESIDQRLEVLKAEGYDLGVTIGQLTAQIDDTLQQKHQELGDRLEQLRNDLVAAREQLAAVRTEVGSIEKQIATLEEQQAELKKRETDVAHKKQDADEWTYLQRACGPDGIQALELDALAPSISDVANVILQSAYGSRFAIDFQTTKMSADGKKQLEDFLIQIHDSEHGTEQELSTLSGGEAVWIKRAIVDAFGIVRDRNTGMRFLTTFADEADGALDPEARENYFRMLQTAHEQSGRAHTLVITHSTEVQELITQRLEMDGLVNVKEAVEV